MSYAEEQRASRYYEVLVYKRGGGEVMGWDSWCALCHRYAGEASHWSSNKHQDELDKYACAAVKHLTRDGTDGADRFSGPRGYCGASEAGDNDLPP